MYSDNWNNEGYKKSDHLKLSQNVSLCTWYSDNETIGISVNFEIADDVHYEISQKEWLKFDNWLKISNNITLQNYFEGMDWLSFEKQLQQLEIKFDKTAYYDYDFD